MAANVQRLRTRKAWTQADLAEAADLAVRFVQRIERAGAKPTLATLIALAAALDVPLARLFKPARMPVAQKGRPPRSRR